MIVLAIVTMLVFTFIATVHLLWANEIWWPIRDERRLVAAVVGFQSATRMPGSIPCFMVMGLMLIGVVLIGLPQSFPRQVAMSVYALALVLRGGITYWRRWRKLTSQEPFARNDLRYYGPLSLALGISMAVLSRWSFAAV